MSENINEAPATPMIYGKIVEVMRAVGAIGKNKQNTHQKYNFRGIDDMYNALHEPMAAAGIFAAPRVLSKEREERKGSGGGNLIYTILEVEHRFYAEDGSNVPVVTIGEAMDSGDKSCNKAQSAAYKYALMELFCIPTEEKLDTEYETHSVAPRESTPARAPQAPPRPQQPQNGQSHANGNGRPPQAAQPPKASTPKLTPMQQLMQMCEKAGVCVEADGKAVAPRLHATLKKENFSGILTPENLQAAFDCIAFHEAEKEAQTTPERGKPMPVQDLAREFDNDNDDPFGD